MKTSHLLLLALLVGSLGEVARGAPADGGTLSLDQILANDAALNDVAYADASNLWAVGDRGVLLHSADGGQHWEQRPLGTTVPLHSVSFVDGQRGWIVGGDATLYGHRTRAVVLRTIDGGATWQPQVADTLPRLTRVKFFDAANGMASGYSSAFYPAGIFASQDGGKSWQPLAGGDRGPWLAADFLSRSAGVALGIGGVQGAIRQGELSPATPTIDPRTPRDVVLTSPTEGWLVGDDGRIAFTSDGGTSWQSVSNLPFAPEAARAFDWRTVKVVGSDVWIAGDPGTVLLHSPDRGQHWELLSTGSSRPIRRLAFGGNRQGVAVGELGMILTTNDGGRSWKNVRGQGLRAPLMVLGAGPESMPLELIARYGAGEGYRTVAVPLLASSEAATAEPDPHRLAHGIASVGGELAQPLWTLPQQPNLRLFDSAEQLWEELNRATDGQARERLLARLVGEIRTWRPDVVIVPQATASRPDAAGEFLPQLLLEATRAAADPTFQIELTTVAGLPPWQVKRVLGHLPAGERGETNIETEEFVSALGGTPAQFARVARGLMARDHVVPPSLDSLKLLWQVEGLQVSTRDPFAGLQLPSASEGRRSLVVADPRDLERLRQLAQRRKQLVRLLEHTEGSPTWSAQVVNLTGGLDPMTGGELLYQLAEGYRETGSPAMTANTLYLLARRYPDHPLTEQSLVWLVKYYASGELAYLADRQRAREVRGQPLANVPASIPGATPIAPPIDSQADSATLSADERYERAQELGKYLEQARPAVYAEPGLRFPLAVAARNLGYSNTADKYFVLASKSNLQPAWRRAALAERWMVEPTELPPGKPMVDCKLSQQEPPHLDGLFDEPMWQEAQPIAIGATDNRGRPTADVAHVRLARDLEYLYIAIESPRLQEAGAPSDAAPRPRDADLTRFDRVTLAIDKDRDYGTAFELTVDCRGWTHDACWGDRSWNPKWYVAHHADETHWRAEIAIPWPELAEPAPAVRDTWALSVSRHLPAGQETTWTGGSRATPEGFGLLIFR